MKTKSYHITLSRFVIRVKSFVYDTADYCNVSVINFNNSGFFYVDYYFTVRGYQDDIDNFDYALKEAQKRSIINV